MVFVCIAMVYERTALQILVSPLSNRNPAAIRFYLVCNYHWLFQCVFGQEWSFSIQGKYFKLF